MDYSSITYDECREFIKLLRRHDIPWDKVRYANNDNQQELEILITLKKKNFEFPENLTVEDWFELVNLEKESEEQACRVETLITPGAIINDDSEENEVIVPASKDSEWQLYRRKLLDKGFKEEDVQAIEDSTLSTLKKLSKKTSKNNAIKGLVIGNVQSGKTANMAGLIAMAADWGWNFFIVLSGTIENLRKQTQERLMEDLNVEGNLVWQSLEHLSKKSQIRLSMLSLHNHSHLRSLCVCLKKSSRLRDLINWLQSDPNKQAQLKILVIDDESDQAGVNTGNIRKNERKTINRLIQNLVNCKNAKDEEISSEYGAMNYVGYTATPYANVLNEAGPETLYPKNFISTLKVSHEYFGPQQIFGVDGSDKVSYPGLNIVRKINSQDLNAVQAIHNGKTLKLPDSLIDAICWFICGVSCMRYWNYHKPVSMLIHTSQKTDHHDHISHAVLGWFKQSSKQYVMYLCQSIWERETSQFSLDEFLEEYPDYGVNRDLIRDYPEFSDIEPYIWQLIGHEVTHIPLDREDEFVYHEGIHFCVDNCKNNKISDEGMYLRLAYPTEQQMPEAAPAFIIVGGATLSRGLTLQGLISTFFLRSVRQADTLMQMGRWFGYRKGYELIPRVWMTENTISQFEFLSTLDEELRSEIYEMSVTGKSPEQYGPRVNNSPKVSFLRITAKNKMQSAVASDMDFTGSFNQTYLFDNDSEVLCKNMKVFINMIQSLGKPADPSHFRMQANNCYIWEDVDFSKIKSFLLEYHYEQRLKVFNNIKELVKWISKMTKDGKLNTWNVVLAGTGKVGKAGKKSLQIGDLIINKVERSRKAVETDYINIGVLQAPADIIADINIDRLNEEQRINLTRATSTNKQYISYKQIREKCGYEMTPQLLLYVIDKDSKARSESRRDLGADEDIVGLCLNIPGGGRDRDYVTKVRIDLSHAYDTREDLEDIDED